MPEISALGPIDPASVSTDEEEKAAPWIVRKLVGVSDLSSDESTNRPQSTLSWYETNR